MPSEELRVTTIHLRELAARHDRAAGEVAAATSAVAGTDHHVRISHGTVATSAAQALLTIEQARRAAGRDIAAASRQLGGDLSAAASRYDATDHLSGSHLNRIPL